MKFDVVIGNPPYQESKTHGKKVTGNGALWVKFTIQAIDLCKNDGYVSFIIPDSWTAPTYDLMGSRKSIFNDYFKQYDLQYVNLDVKKYFLTVGIDPSAFLLKKSSKYSVTKFVTPKGDVSIDVNTMSFITRDVNATALRIHEKVLSRHKNKRLFKMRWTKTVTGITAQEDKDKEFKYPSIDHHSNKPVRWANSVDPDASKRKILIPYVGSYQCIVDDTGMYGAKESVSVLFLDQNDVGSYCRNFFNSKLVSYILNKNRWTQYTLAQILNYIPVEDFTVEWSDEKIYQHFGLTQEEIDYVEANS
jgi:site-specific DNA-methyltransferase (adenine-specific)